MAKVDIEAPSNEHLESVVMSLIDLQYSYDLKPENIMKGELLDYRVNSSISSKNYQFSLLLLFQRLIRKFLL